MKRRNQVLGSLVGLVFSAAFVIYVMRALRGEDLRVYATPRTVMGICIAIVLYCASLPATTLAWRSLLRGLGVRKSWRELTAIVMITQFAKYMPGNVAQYIGRATMSLKRGISTREFGVTTVLETLLTIGAAILVGCGAGMLSSYGRSVIHGDAPELLLILFLIAAALAGLVLVRTYALPLLRRFAPQRAHMLEGQLLPSYAHMARAFMMYCIAYGVIGVGFVVLAHLLLPHGTPHHNWLLTASFALAWVAGFIAPGAPAGLGVRESLLLLMLVPTYPPAAASLLVIALRIVTTLGDLVNFGAGFVLLPRRVSDPSPQP